MAHSYTWLDRVQESINLLQTFSQNTFRATPTSEQQVKLYVEWFVKVESIIGELLKAVGIVVDSGVDPVTGLHRYHENMLESLRHPSNPYHSILGKGEVQDVLTEAKEIRNSVIGKSSRPGHRVSPDWRRWRDFVKQVERALLISTGIMGCEKKHIEHEESIDKKLDDIKQRTEVARALSVSTTEEIAAVNALRESTSKNMAALQKKREEHEALVESETAALEEAYKGRMENFRIAIKRERAAVLAAEAMEAERKKANQIHSPEQQHLLDRLQKLGVAEKQLKEDRDSLQREQEAHKADVQHKTADVEKHWQNREIVFDQAVEKRAKQEIVRAIAKDIENRTSQFALLRKENDELKQKLSQEVSQQAESNNILCSILIDHLRARSPNSTPTIVVGNMGNVGRHLPMALVKVLKASHIYSEKKAEAAENEQKALQQKINDLQHRLLVAEAAHTSDRETVMSLLTTVDRCNNPAHQLLMTLFRNEEPLSEQYGP